MGLLTIQAGKQAYARIQDCGLRVSDVGTVMAASGAAKWLTISELDAAIFGQWLSDATEPVHLFGTSVGAWKLAAAAQENPAQALREFAQAYCQQRYSEGITHTAIQLQTNRIIAAILSPEKIQSILDNPKFYYHCGAVRCRGWLAREAKLPLALAMFAASGLNALSRPLMRHFLSRVVFFDKREPAPVAIRESIACEQVPLDAENFVAALTASGSIPYLMAGIDHIAGARPGMYRDGGLVDYHPLPSKFWREEKLILYPHFYSHLYPGWFDKSLPWRKARAAELENVVLISPSIEFIQTLPGGRIPDRQDFKHYLYRDDERITRWQHCIDKGKDLAKEFLDCVNSSKLRQLVKPF